MKTNLVNVITNEMAQDQGLAGEFLTYMALLRLPPPCRVFFNYKIMADEMPLAEIDMLLLTHGGMFVIEVKTQLSKIGEVSKRNKERIRLLRERLSASKKSLPIYSVVVFHNERQDKWVWAQDATLITHHRYLLPTIAWMAKQQPQALDNERIIALGDKLQTLAQRKRKTIKRPSAQNINPSASKIQGKKGNSAMVHRIFTGRREGFELEAQCLQKEWREQLGVKGLTHVEVFQRYDVEGIDEALLERCIPTVFSEPQTDVVLQELPNNNAFCFAVEYLPGQYDQRADSCEQCIQIVSGGQKPAVRTAKVYLLHGKLSKDDLARVQKATINPVESRLASFELPQTLKMTVEPPKMVRTAEGFRQLNEAGLQNFLKKHSLAMDLDDLRFCQAYFQSEQRDPTITEIRMIDTYWSDHCRHTTFLTHLDEITIEDPRAKETYERFLEIKRELGREDKPTTLMEVATQAMRYLRHTGKLDRLDESDEINACTVKTEVTIQDAQGKEVVEPWLFLFKNETHNHPTEIEPFGGAATCIGGAIRDPLSGRGYVYQAMRITGAADPTVPIDQTIPGKLPQRKIVTTAADGYSSYGNQIGLATGLVDEIYHPGFMAKRLELGAVVGAVPQAQVRREVPAPGDKVILLGGRTGRDGCGGATGSSKSHTLESLETCGAEVQKGNAPEERKLMRLFRNPEAARMIKRCNDFGAGGVSVAIGELCDGLVINLDAIPVKYDGLDGTEIAISESQERMAIVVEAGDVERFLALADTENLEATVVAEVQEKPRLQMNWRSKMIVDLSREFLNSNGAAKTAKALIPMRNAKDVTQHEGTFGERMRVLASDLNTASKRGLAERFDSTIGAGSIFMPFGGKHQQTPAQVMAAKLPLRTGETTRASVMAYGYDPFLTEADPYKGAYCAVVESVTKLVAAGCPLNECYLSFQEYFERMTADSASWGKPLAALLGALRAQLDLGLASIGGKDSMSGTFEQINVPPTLVSFAVALTDYNNLVSNEFKRPGRVVAYVAPPRDANGFVKPKQALAQFAQIAALAAEGKISAAQAVGAGGIAEALLHMTLGNKIGFAFTTNFLMEYAFLSEPGAMILELTEPCSVGTLIGHTTADYTLRTTDECISLAELEALYEGRLASVFPMQVKIANGSDLQISDYTQRSNIAPAIKTARPRVLIPVFPGTNCEYDSARAFEKAGAETEILVINNQSANALAESVERMAKALDLAQVLFLPGGFSGGDEPDGSGKFITAFLRNPKLCEAVTKLLDERFGLIGGICNGFQALIKLGLVPFGKITDMRPDCPTLTFNSIGRHQSKLVRTRVASVLSPWLALCEPGDVHLMPISNGEGRFVCPEPLLKHLIEKGQVATQYVDLDNRPTMDIQYNPSSSVCAVEGITSPDGRVFGKMGHAERVGPGLYRNVPGETDNKMFTAAIQYFK